MLILFIFEYFNLISHIPVCVTWKAENEQKCDWDDNIIGPDGVFLRIALIYSIIAYITMAPYFSTIN